MNFIFYALINIILVLLIAPFYMGLIKKVKALAQGRKGPGFFQQYYNLIKLLKKEVVYSTTSSFIMRLSPFLNVVILLVAVLLVPLIYAPVGGIEFASLILLLYILALAKIFMVLGGLDAGSTFGGMGSSREMTISSIIEPVIIIVFATLVFIFKTTNISSIFLAVSSNYAMLLGHPALILVAVSFFILYLAETSRVPVDNPETHLELTMVHEAMILEQAGPNLALMELAAAIKQLILIAIFVNIFLPFGVTTSLTAMALLAAFVAFFVKGSLFAILTGIVESSLVKLRLFKLPNLFFIGFILSFVAVLVEVFLGL